MWRSILENRLRYGRILRPDHHSIRKHVLTCTSKAHRQMRLSTHQLTGSDLHKYNFEGWVMISDKTETICRKTRNQAHSEHNWDYLESEANWVNSAALSGLPANSSCLGSGCRAVGISPAESSSCLNRVWGPCHTNHVSDSHNFFCCSILWVNTSLALPYQGLPLVVQHSVLGIKMLMNNR